MVTIPRLDLTTDDFEVLYAEAHGDPSVIPWADGRPHPALLAWLNAVAPSLVRCGARVAVVGCGLGDDAREVRRRGYDVTAFDCSPTAIEWAKSIAPLHADCFHVADLFALPGKWRHRFDLVLEVNTLGALPPERRDESVGAIADLLSPHGYLLVICRGCDDPYTIDDGPPWAITEEQLASATAQAGLVSEGPVSTFLDNEMPPVRRMRALFRRLGV